MIPKSVKRFSEKIVLKQTLKRDDDSKKKYPALGSFCTRRRSETSLDGLTFRLFCHPCVTKYGHDGPS